MGISGVLLYSPLGVLWVCVVCSLHPRVVDPGSDTCNFNCSGAGEGNGTPLQYSCLENPVDGGAWWAAVHGVVKSRTRLRDFTFTFRFHALEKKMATHSSVLAWRIPEMAETGGLPSMGSHRVGHDWSDLAAAAYLYVCWYLCFGLLLKSVQQVNS